MFTRLLSVHRSALLNCRKILLCEPVTMPYYAVARGRSAGIYNSWGDCEDQVKGYSGAVYKKFNSASEAQEFVEEKSGGGYSGGSSYSGGGDSYVGSRTHNVSSTSIPVNKNIFVQSVPSKNYSTKRPNEKVNTQSTGVDNETCTSLDIDDFDEPFDIDEVVNKKLDKLENMTKKVVKVNNKSSKKNNKRTLPTEAHHLNKRRRSTNEGYDVDDNGFVQVYTDGACSSNGRQGARAGYGVWWGDDHPLNESGRVERSTNNSGEIRAAARACQQAKDNDIPKIRINTDSKFLIDSATKWMPGWKSNNYQLKSGGPVKNADDFKELDRASKGLDVQWRYVEAHRGVYGNERADELARRGAASDK